MKSKITADDLSSWPIELLRIVGPDEAEHWSTLSWDTIKRDHSEKIIQLSARRVGMRVGHALMLRENDRQRVADRAKAPSS
jgi:hypothetical protein